MSTLTDPEPLSSKPSLNAGERVADELRQRLVAGAYRPGQRLSEQALSEDLGISRNTLREVFRMLTRDGLLRHEPNRGVFVAAPDAASIIDIYRVRRLIECPALAGAYPHHPGLVRMNEAVRQALAAREQSDWRGVGTANMAFHMAVVELADSPRLNHLFGQLLAELRLAFGLVQDPAAVHGPYVDMNAQILSLAGQGKFTEAAQALGHYLTQSERVVLAVIARQSPSDA